MILQRNTGNIYIAREGDTVVWTGTTNIKEALTIAFREIMNI